MAVTCVHDFIQAMISNHQELPHFHINEFLCKTFENMLCLELCDGDVQDQVSYTDDFFQLLNLFQLFSSGEKLLKVAGQSQQVKNGPFEMCAKMVSAIFH